MIGAEIQDGLPATRQANGLFGLYLVLTDPVVGYERCTEAAVKAKLRYIQLRMKHAAPAKRLEHARNLRAITAGSETRFIVNDDPEIAADCGADGVHLGQTDMAPDEVLRCFPQLRCLGISTHTLAQAKEAARHSPDYIGVGPVYPTPTKEIPDPALGCTETGRIIRAVTVPAVAIGGIDTDNLRDVLKAGAVNFAVVRAVCASPTPYDAIRRIMDIWHQSVLPPT